MTDENLRLVLFNVQRRNLGLKERVWMNGLTNSAYMTIFAEILATLYQYLEVRRLNKSPRRNKPESRVWPEAILRFDCFDCSDMYFG